MASETEPVLGPADRHPITVYDAQLSLPERVDTGPPYFRGPPLRLVAYDLGVVLKHAAQIPNIVRPLSPRSDVGPLGAFVQVIFVLVSFGLTALAVLSLGTGLPTPILVALAIILAVVIMSRLQGQIKMDDAREDKFEDEAWVFVNGIATSASGLQLIFTRLHEIFGRRVMGIHNKTFGIWWDLIECLLQRDFLFATADIRVGYQVICDHIRNPKKKKVVLMAHSQGGIIMSTWVDQLLSDFPADALRKVEIYTFANAANHFSVPSSPIFPDENADALNAEASAPHADAVGTGPRQVGRRFVFGIVEHFVNTKDYVSLVGLLEFAPKPPPNTVPGILPDIASEGRFGGRIVRREGHTGHLLLAHYLKDGDSILNHPTVVRYSQLVRYKDGQTADPESRFWKPTVITQIPAVAGQGA